MTSVDIGPGKTGLPLHENTHYSELEPKTLQFPFVVHGKRLTERGATDFLYAQSEGVVAGENYLELVSGESIDSTEDNYFFPISDKQDVRHSISVINFPARRCVIVANLTRLREGLLAKEPNVNRPFTHRDLMIIKNEQQIGDLIRNGYAATAALYTEHRYNFDQGSLLPQRKITFMSAEQVDASGRPINFWSTKDLPTDKYLEVLTRAFVVLSRYTHEVRLLGWHPNMRRYLDTYERALVAQVLDQLLAADPKSNQLLRWSSDPLLSFKEDLVFFRESERFPRKYRRGGELPSNEVFYINPAKLTLKPFEQKVLSAIGETFKERKSWQDSIRAWKQDVGPKVVRDLEKVHLGR